MSKTDLIKTHILICKKKNIILKYFFSLFSQLCLTTLLLPGAAAKQQHCLPFLSNSSSSTTRTNTGCLRLLDKSVTKLNQQDKWVALGQNHRWVWYYVVKIVQKSIILLSEKGYGIEGGKMLHLLFYFINYPNSQMCEDLHKN